MSPAGHRFWRSPAVKLALLAHWDEFRKGSTHCGLFVLTQAFDCYSKGGKKVAEVPPSSPLPAGTVPSTGHRAQEVRKGWAPEEQPAHRPEAGQAVKRNTVTGGYPPATISRVLTPNCP